MKKGHTMDTPLTVESIYTTKVTELKGAFMASKLVTPGRKAVFIARLELAVKNGMAKVENIDPSVVANIAGG